MICKRCQTEIPAGERFCPTCGALQPMICPDCGAESRPGSKTCAACGKKLPMADRPDKLVYTKRKRRMGEMVAIFAVVLGALLILGGAVFFLTQSVDFGPSQPENPEIGEPQAPEQTPEEPPQEPEEIPVEEEPVQEEPGEEAPPVEEEPAEETPAEETPAEEDPSEEEPVVDAYVDAEWIFPDSSERLLTGADLEGLSAWELKVARNEIYARHGRRFNSADLQAHFDGCSWYEGTVAPENFSDTMLSDTELANVQFLKAAE